MELQKTATALACPNIAFVKYWGNRDASLNLPSNGSISMNLGGLTTLTSVAFNADLPADCLLINHQQINGPALQRVSAFLDRVRKLAGIRLFSRVESENNFPMGAGIASSASAFAALSLAASAAAGLSLSEKELSRLARAGSGSACRSVPGGFVEWQAGQDDDSSFAFSIAPHDYWELADCIALISSEHKPTGSSQGHALADTSPLQPARLAQVQLDLEVCRAAIRERDFDGLARVLEAESNLMHAVMITSRPPLFYWQAASLAVMQAVIEWRKAGLPVAYTLDAGPNVHVLCPRDRVEEMRGRLAQVPGVEDVLVAYPGGPARLVSSASA
ncbi:MAG TPA: diphosphomevalonate decarboxylase [Anaerolineales bacterium]